MRAKKSIRQRVYCLRVLRPTVSINSICMGENCIVWLDSFHKRKTATIQAKCMYGTGMYGLSLNNLQRRLLDMTIPTICALTSTLKKKDM